MYVGGNFDLTVEGDYNINVKGNKYEHVSGHSYNTVMGNRLNKMQGHELIDTESTYHLITVGNFNCQVGSTDKEKKQFSNYKLRVSGDTNTTHQGPHRVMNASAYDNVTDGDINFTVKERLGINPAEAMESAVGGQAASMDAIVAGGSFKVSADRNVDLTAQPTDFIKTPLTGSSINISADRVNTTARVDMVERIGQIAGVHDNVDSQIIPQLIGRKSTFAVGPTGGIYNVYSPAPIVLPSALSYLTPMTIGDDIIGAGHIIRNITGAGNFVDVLAGLGTMSRTASLGAIADNAVVGAVSYAAGGAASLTAGGVATVRAGGALALTGGGAVTITGLTIALV